MISANILNGWSNLVAFPDQPRPLKNAQRGQDGRADEEVNLSKEFQFKKEHFPPLLLPVNGPLGCFLKEKKINITL